MKKIKILIFSITIFFLSSLFVVSPLFPFLTSFLESENEYTETEFLEFIPSGNTAKNVTPFGNNPVLNITNLGYSRNADLSIYLNETNSCINVTLSQTTDKNDGFIINGSWQNITLNSKYLNYTNISLWVDYACANQQNRTLFLPFIHFRQCATQSLCSEDLI